MKSHKFWHYLIIAVILNLIYVAVDSFASIYGLSRLYFYFHTFAPDVLILLMILLAIRYAKKTKDNHPRLKACLLFLISSVMTFFLKGKLYSITLAISSLFSMYHSNDEIYPYLINVSICDIQALNRFQQQEPSERDRASFCSWAKIGKIDSKDIETLSYSDSMLSVQWTIDKNGIVMSGENKTTGVLTIDSLEIISPDYFGMTHDDDDMYIFPTIIHAQDSLITTNGISQFNKTLTSNIEFLNSFPPEYKSLVINFTIITENDKIRYSFNFRFYNRRKGDKEKCFWVKE